MASPATTTAADEGSVVVGEGTHAAAADGVSIVLLVRHFVVVGLVLL